MSEILSEQDIRIPHNPMMQFYNAVKDIESLYPKLRLIQDRIDGEKKIFSCTITITEPLLPAQEEEIQRAVSDLIQAIILPVLPEGFQSTTQDVTFIVQENSPSEVKHDPETNLETVLRAVEAEFARDEIHIVYENGTFIVYGAAPADQSILRGSIINKIPHNLPCRLEFRSGAEWEKEQDTTRTIRNTNSSLTRLEIRGTRPFSGIALTLAQMAEVIRDRVLPPR